MARAAHRKASTPRVIGLPMNANITGDFVDEIQTSGAILKVRVGRRVGNVFEALHVSGAITDEERVAANDLIEIFAKSQGHFGVGERSLERVQFETSDPHRQAFIKAQYGVQFNEIMARLEQHHEILLKAIIGDFVLGDGAGLGCDGVRWRAIVRDTVDGSRYQLAAKRSGAPTGKCRISYEAQPVALAVSHLPDAVISYRKMQARNRRA